MRPFKIPVSVGDKYGKWTIVDSKRVYGKVLCLCECGVNRYVHLGDLVRGQSKSCGCVSGRSRKPKTLRHGLSYTPTHNSWLAAKGRCFNPKDKKYPDYGGRGITMCDRWRYSFEAFVRDMGTKPEEPCYSLERIDVNGHYEPGNCKWATLTEQSRNRRNNVVIEFGGKRQLAADWARDLGIRDNTLHYRLRTGRSMDEIVKEFGYAC